MRIPTLLQKISDLADQPDRRTTIDVDLMLDYTRVLYADLLEWRGRLAAPARQVPTNISAVATPVANPAPVPTPAAPPIQKGVPLPTPPVSTNPVQLTITNDAPSTAAKTVSPPVAKTPPNPLHVPPLPPVIPSVARPPFPEPTLAELAASMDQAIKEEDEEDEAGPVIPAIPSRQSAPPDGSATGTGTPPPAQKSQSAASAIPTPAPKTQVQKTLPPIPESRDIRGMISINEKYQIMSELFGNDKDAYEHALNHINDAASDSAALKWLQEQLWVTEERSEAAQSFFDLVKRFKKSGNQVY